MIGARETLNQSNMNTLLKNFTQIEIVDRISSSLSNLPIGIRSEVGIVYNGCQPPYVYAEVEEWDEANQEANANKDYIDNTFWQRSWHIDYDMSYDRVAEILEDIDTKVGAYHAYFQQKIDEVSELYEEQYGELAEWVAFDRTKLQIIATRKDYYNNFRDEFCKDENIVILRIPDDIPF